MLTECVRNCYDLRRNRMILVRSCPVFLIPIIWNRKMFVTMKGTESLQMCSHNLLIYGFPVV